MGTRKAISKICFALLASAAMAPAARADENASGRNSHDSGRPDWAMGWDHGWERGWGLGWADEWNRERDRCNRDGSRGDPERDDQRRFVFIVEPSSSGVAGQNLAEGPRLAAVDRVGLPVFSPLHDIKIAAYLDRDCSAPAPQGHLSGSAHAPAIGFGMLIFENVSETASGTYYYKVSAQGVQSACSSKVVISAGPADHLLDVSGNGQSGQPDQALPILARVKVVDAYDNPVSGVGIAYVPASGGGSASPSATVTDPTGTAASSLTLGAHAGVETWTVRRSGGSLAGNPNAITFTATVVGASPSPTPSPTPTPVAVKLALAGPSTQQAGGCSSAFTVTAQDANGQAVVQSSALPVSVTGLGSAVLYSDSACASAATSVTIAAQASAASFYVKDTHAEAIAVQVSAQSLSASQSVSDAVQAAAASVISAAAGSGQSANVDTKLPTSLQVQVTDSFGNPVSGATVNFAVVSGGGSVSPASAATDANGLASTQLTLGSVAGADVVSASVASNGTSVSFNETATPLPAVAVLLTGSASSVAGVCTGPYSAQLMDQNNSVTTAVSDTSIALSGAGNGAFYLDSGCATAAVTSATIAHGQSSVAVYFADTSAETVTLVAQGAGLSASSVQVAVASAVASVLSFSTQPSSSGTASQALTAQPVVSVFDAYGNAALSYGGAVALSAFTDAACTAPASGVLSATANPVSSTDGIAAFAGVSYSGAGTIYLKASSGQLTSACSQSIQLTSTILLAGGSTSTCVLQGGGVKCWGGNTMGQLGNGTTTNSTSPQQVNGLTSGVTALVVGNQFACAATGNTLYCWGSNTSGQLGNGTTQNSNVPVTVSTFSGKVAQIVAGDSNTCVLVDGTVYCWGDNSFGELGTGTTQNSSVPVAVQGLPGPVQSIAETSASVCAVIAGGTAYCWGYNDNGQLGNGLTQNSSVPVAVEGLPGAVQTMSPSVENNCALLMSGSVYCWGLGTSGQLGDGTFNSSMTPQQVVGVSGATRIVSSGQSFSCVLTASGAVQCWGADNRGQLGDNKVAGADSNVPVQVVGLTSGVQDLSAGYQHACASDGTHIECWGFNTSGQLGDGSTVESNMLVEVIGY